MSGTGRVCRVQVWRRVRKCTCHHAAVASRCRSTSVSVVQRPSRVSHHSVQPIPVMCSLKRRGRNVRGVPNGRSCLVPSCTALIIKRWGLHDSSPRAASTFMCHVRKRSGKRSKGADNISSSGSADPARTNCPEVHRSKGFGRHRKELDAHDAHTAVSAGVCELSPVRGQRKPVPAPGGRSSRRKRWFAVQRFNKVSPWSKATCNTSFWQTCQVASRDHWCRTKAVWYASRCGYGG